MTECAIIEMGLMPGLDLCSGIARNCALAAALQQRIRPRICRCCFTLCEKKRPEGRVLHPEVAMNSKRCVKTFGRHVVMVLQFVFVATDLAVQFVH